MELAYPPFETKDDAGQPAGLAVDFMRDFADRYGYDLVIENTAWDGLIPSLQTDKADCVISSMTITEERKEAVDFSDPYAMAQLAILANANSGVASIDDLNHPDKKVAVKTGSTGDVYATKNLPEAPDRPPGRRERLRHRGRPGQGRRLSLRPADHLPQQRCQPGYH